MKMKMIRKHQEHYTHNNTTVKKKERERHGVYINDTAIPGESRIEKKEQEKITKYQDLQRELEHLWKKVTIGSSA